MELITLEGYNQREFGSWLSLARLPKIPFRLPPLPFKAPSIPIALPKPIKIPKLPTKLNIPTKVKLPTKLNIPKVKLPTKLNIPTKIPSMIPNGITSKFSSIMRPTGDGRADLLSQLTDYLPEPTTQSESIPTQEFYTQSAPTQEFIPMQNDDTYEIIEQVTLDGFKFKLPNLKLLPKQQKSKKPIINIGNKIKIYDNKLLRAGTAAAVVAAGVVAALPSGGTSLAAATATASGLLASGTTMLSSPTAIGVMASGSALYQASQTGNVSQGLNAALGLASSAGINTAPAQEFIQTGTSLFNQGNDLVNQALNLIPEQPQNSTKPSILNFNQKTENLKSTKPTDDNLKLMDVNVSGSGVGMIALGVGILFLLGRSKK